MLFDPNGLMGVEPLDKKRAKVLLLFGIHKFFGKKMQNYCIISSKGTLTKSLFCHKGWGRESSGALLI